MLELVTDRYLQKALVDLNSHCLALLSDQPQRCMCDILKKASEMIPCEGISFFAIDPYDEADNFRLVGTFPKNMPQRPVVYDPNDNTFTSRLLNCEKDCVVHYTDFHRNSLPGFSNPKWKDVPDNVISRTVLYLRVMKGEQTAGLLRCTNRMSKEQSPWFNWVDIRRAKALASLLLPYYKAAQAEDRFASSLSDISHEIKTTAASISYTAQNIRDRIQSIPSAQDIQLKLGHIDRAAKGLTKLLPSLRAAAAPESIDTAAAVRIASGFKPYADLCKPITEMFVQKARQKECGINHVGQDQLGLIYADVEDFRHIMQNLISNAVKYTFPGKSIYINYERPGFRGADPRSQETRLRTVRSQFAAIHVLSESLSILPEEAEFIFKYRQRGKAARQAGIEGEGIGLAIARAKARQYGGDVIFSNRDRFNRFSVLIPRSLFLPQR